MKKTIKEFPEYSISQSGTVWKGEREIFIQQKKSRGKIYFIVALSNSVDKKGIKIFKRRALASLVAEHFVENKYNYKNVIFKDRDSLNCTAENLAYVDDSTFKFYCKWNRKKLLGNRFDAAKKCVCDLLRKYYETLDESYIWRSWIKCKKKLFCKDIRHIESDLIDYFFDRARRFSLIGHTEGLMYLYAKLCRRNIKRDCLYNDNISAEYRRGGLNFFR